MNYLTLYHDKTLAARQGSWLVDGHGKAPATDCIQCSRCEEVCPQHIQIRDNLKKVSAELLT